MPVRESWALVVLFYGGRGAQDFEMGCCRGLLDISYRDHVDSGEVRRKMHAAIGEYDELLTNVKKRSLRRFWPRLRVSWLSKDNPAGPI